MKMAKADKTEWEAVMRFANELEEEIKYRHMTDEELGAWARKAPCLFRVVFGYQTLVDNCADPNLDYLDFNPEIKRVMEAPDTSYSHNEIEAACGGEVAQDVAAKVKARRDSINAQLAERVAEPSNGELCSGANNQ